MAITYTHTLYLHVLAIQNRKSMPKTICVSGKHSHIATKLRQPTAQAVSRADGPAIRLRRIERRAHMKNSHAGTWNEPGTIKLKGFHDTTNPKDTSRLLPGRNSLPQMI